MLASAAFDWTTDIGLLLQKVSDSVSANIGAVLQIFAFLAAINLVFRLLSRATRVPDDELR